MDSAKHERGDLSLDATVAGQLEVKNKLSSQLQDKTIDVNALLSSVTAGDTSVSKISSSTQTNTRATWASFRGVRSPNSETATKKTKVIDSSGEVENATRQFMPAPDSSLNKIAKTQKSIVEFQSQAFSNLECSIENKINVLHDKIDDVKKNNGQCIQKELEVLCDQVTNFKNDCSNELQRFSQVLEDNASSVKTEIFELVESFNSLKKDVAELKEGEKDYAEHVSNLKECLTQAVKDTAAYSETMLISTRLNRLDRKTSMWGIRLSIMLVCVIVSSISAVCLMSWLVL